MNHSEKEHTSLDITIIVDRSGSMEAIREDAIGSFNAFLSDQKKQEPDAIMTLVLFDDEVDVIYNAVPIANIPPLTKETFVPRGSTALLDAIGRTIGAIQSRPAKNQSILVAILTDGEENASCEWGLNQIREKINELEDLGWDFCYLSSDLNAFTDAVKMGFKPGKIYQSHGADMKGAYDNISEEILKKKLLMQKHWREEQAPPEEDKMFQ
jgi:Mg-chelatase subunit ChlD